MNRGSEWGRWDLHVHTKGTAKNDQFKSSDFNGFCKILFKNAILKDIKVVGITDYFSIENYKKVAEYQKNIEQSFDFSKEEKLYINGITCIPNIELRISPTVGGGSLINIHVIFNPQIIKDFENIFLTQLCMDVGGGQKFNLTRHGLVSLGRYHSPDIHLDNEAYKRGVEQFCVPHTELINIIENSKILKENCLIFVANGGNDGISGLRGHEDLLVTQNASIASLRDTIYRFTDGLFSAKPSDVEYFLGKRKDNAEAIIRKYRSLKPCIHGSDAHTEDKLFEPDQKRYCWIKAEPTFEGLKQILHEPETRVYIGATKPEPKSDYEVIDYIQLKNENVFNEKIFFNSNLTSIIGGRSSGKSTLLQCLAKKLKAGSFDSDEPYDHIDSLCTDLKIIWKDGVEDDTRPIEYFYQGHMYKRSKGEGIEDIVKELLLQQQPDLFQKFDQTIAKIKHDNSGMLSNYFSIIEQIKQKKISLQSLGKLEDVIAQIKTLSDQIKSYQTDDISEQELKDHDQKQYEVAELDKEIQDIGKCIIKLNQIEVKEFYYLSNPLVQIYKYSNIQNIVEHTLNNIQSHTEVQIKNMITQALQLLNEQCQNTTDVRNRISCSPQFLKISEFLAKTESLKPILEQKENEEKKRKYITEVLIQIEQLEQNADKLKLEVRKNWLSMFTAFDEIIEEIKTFNVSDVLQITAVKNFQQSNYQEFIIRPIHQKGEKAQNFANQIVPSEDILLNVFDELTKAIESNELKCKIGSSLENITKEFFDKPWFKLQYDVIYDGDNYNAMSQGKKAFVVLKMSLDCSESKCPIVIDQPEDDLDNRAIYTELVSYLKIKKSQRQIILVTHNANVVVNADSELIIVANQHGAHSPNNNKKKFQYKHGSIECLRKSSFSKATLESKTIKEHICEILEGGDIAFKLRERKYNLI